MASFFQLLDASRRYGLVSGGPGVDLDRCDRLLREGARRGFRPARHEQLVARYLKGNS